MEPEKKTSCSCRDSEEERRLQVQQILSIASLGGKTVDESVLQAALAYEKGELSREEFEAAANAAADR